MGGFTLLNVHLVAKGGRTLENDGLSAREQLTGEVRPEHLPVQKERVTSSAAPARGWRRVALRRRAVAQTSSAQ